MAFENLTERLQNVFKNLRGKKKITETDVTEITKEIRVALLEADVALPVVKKFIKAIRERAVDVEVSEALNPAQQVIKIVDEELTAILGGGEAELLKSPKIPTIIMMVGLQGAGKTTFAGKLAKKLKEEQNARPLMIAADVYRPAAIDQLKTLGEQLEIPVYDEGTAEKPVNIVRNGLLKAQEERKDYVLIDTAGRLEIDDTLMNEFQEIKALAEPTEILLVVDAMTGQVAAQVAKTFDEKLDITGVIITKLDGDTRGGAALSIREITGKPIKFTGTGEKLTDLEVFYPDRMSSRILGMGDMLTLIEKAQANYDEEQSAKLAEKMAENRFDYEDFVEQLDQVTNMGPMEDIMKMIPGMSQMPGLDKVKVDPKDVARKRAMVLSMTTAERHLEAELSPARRRRIAAGSGNSFIEVNKFIKQFNQSKEMMQGIMNGDMNSMMQKMMGGAGGQMPNMPTGSGMPDMSSLGDLQGMMGNGSANGMPDMTSMFVGGLKGKATEFAMKQAMKRAQKKMKKGKKKR
ncbi:Signal recognition particle subunit Ffh SRP54 [Lactococcus lactis subsp. lactis]|uniref:Signal recognition particle protein n=2 Tax=Lactococcus lactis TaxID=1358 RepID=A0A2A5SB62_LACLH|nr:signal recognition particle protein [Lactococcus lactis]KAA8701878.1 signal recognition particle protein [Lactococcus lactis subsp. hordniae]KSU05151.1 Signal recognition particle subunit Ffh SRP54 [Lactococcus lactis subsp. lactis]MCT3134162.1 signal recognition particle protein [Lactococcus lactis]PCS10698.1 Signal recognition particle protein [Lactococcus lactis subsp. hordniae]